MCQDARRNSPSVTVFRPASRWSATTSRIASSSIARSSSSEMRWAAWSERACRRSAGRRRLPTWSAREGGAVRAAILLLAVPVAVAPLATVFDAGPLVTALLTGYALVGLYEWTHFLIHTAVRPRSRYYRSIWRNHRLHHFKNEHYWHGITNTVSDRALGTFRDHREVRRSATARTLHGG